MCCVNVYFFLELPPKRMRYINITQRALATTKIFHFLEQQQNSMRRTFGTVILCIAPSIYSGTLAHEPYNCIYNCITAIQKWLHFFSLLAVSQYAHTKTNKSICAEISM